MSNLVCVLRDHLLAWVPFRLSREAGDGDDATSTHLITFSPVVSVLIWDEGDPGSIPDLSASRGERI